LIANKTLTELKLAQTGLNSEGAISIAEIFPLNKTLRILDLRLNPIEIAGVVALSVSLKMNNTITSLQLSQFSLQNESVEIEPEFQRILYDILVSCSRNMSLNPYLEYSQLKEFKELEMDQLTSPLESNDRFYQKILNTPKKLMKKNSNANNTINSNKNSISSGQGQLHNSSSSNLPNDTNSNSSMDNNIDLEENEQLKVNYYYYYY